MSTQNKICQKFEEDYIRTYRYSDKFKELIIHNNFKCYFISIYYLHLQSVNHIVAVVPSMYGQPDPWLDGKKWGPENRHKWKTLISEPVSVDS
jgi:hypothetical protein